jgi:hypothetical protein
MQGEDTSVEMLMTHLDTWMGDRVAESQGVKSGENASRLAKCGAKLAVAVLRGHIARAGLVKTLRRFLAAMLPAGADAVSEGEDCHDDVTACRITDIVHFPRREPPNRGSYPE